jgi:hypothetical protein
VKLSILNKASLSAGLLALLLAGTACDSYGGADVYLENISIGNITVEGKPVTGLPTQKVNIVLKTNASKVMVSQSGGKTVIRLLPSGAVINSSPDGLSFTGVKAEQVEMKWGTENITK